MPGHDRLNDGLAEPAEVGVGHLVGEVEGVRGLVQQGTFPA